MSANVARDTSENPEIKNDEWRFCQGGKADGVEEKRFYEGDSSCKAIEAFSNGLKNNVADGRRKPIKGAPYVP